MTLPQGVHQEETNEEPQDLELEGDESSEETDEQPPAPAGDNISLTRSEYNQMLAVMATMQAQLAQGQQRQQTQAPPQPEITPEQLDQMSQRQLVDYIQQQQQPLMQTVMNMAVQLELRDVNDKYADFKSYQDDVYKIASNNPSLSLEQAYLIAKSQKPAATTTKPKPKVVGNKPPAPPPATKHSTSTNIAEAHKLMDTRAAAIAAAKELGIE